MRPPDLALPRKVAGCVHQSAPPSAYSQDVSTNPCPLSSTCCPAARAQHDVCNTKYTTYRPSHPHRPYRPIGIVQSVSSNRYRPSHPHRPYRPIGIVHIVHIVQNVWSKSSISSECVVQIVHIVQTYGPNRPYRPNVWSKLSISSKMYGPNCPYRPNRPNCIYCAGGMITVVQRNNIIMHIVRASTR